MSYLGSGPAPHHRQRPPAAGDRSRHPHRFEARDRGRRTGRAQGSALPKVVFWLALSLSVVALSAVGVELVGAGRVPATSDEERDAARAAALVAGFYADVWNGGQPARVTEYVAPDHRYHDPDNPDVEPGAEGVDRLVAAHRAAFPDAVVTIDDLVATGDKVAVRFTRRGTQRGEVLGAAPTGGPVAVTGVAVLRVAHGQIAETWVSWDAYGLARQVGLYLVPATGRDGDWEPAPSRGRSGKPH